MKKLVATTLISSLIAQNAALATPRTDGLVVESAAKAQLGLTQLKSSLLTIEHDLKELESSIESGMGSGKYAKATTLTLSSISLILNVAGLAAFNSKEGGAIVLSLGGVLGLFTTGASAVSGGIETAMNEEVTVTDEMRASLEQAISGFQSIQPTISDAAVKALSIQAEESLVNLTNEINAQDSRQRTLKKLNIAASASQVASAASALLGKISLGNGDGVLKFAFAASAVSNIAKIILLTRDSKKGELLEEIRKTRSQIVNASLGL